MDAERSTRETEAGGRGLDWHALASAAGIQASERLLLALSGGRDSVALFHLLARAEPRPDFAAAHVDHGWRGERSQADARFCAELARTHGVPFECVMLALDGRAPNAEAVARRERYRALAALARSTGRTTVLTAHHEDDVVEGVLLHTRRFGQPGGYIEPGARLLIRGATIGEAPLERASPELARVEVVRPLAATPRSRLEDLLRSLGASWCEDESNGDLRRARNALRAELARGLTGAQRSQILAEARGRARFDADVESLVPQARRPSHVRLTRAPDCYDLGAAFDSAGLVALPEEVRVSVVARIAARTCGAVPKRAVLVRIGAAIARRERLHCDLAGGWHVLHGRGELLVLPPDTALGPLPAPLEYRGEQLVFADGRRLESQDVLAAGQSGRVHSVRPLAAGDRWQSAPTRPLRLLTRHLAELGVPPSERGRVLVAADEHGRVLGMLDFRV